MTRLTYTKRIRRMLYDVLFIWRREMKLLFKDQGVLIFFLLVPLVYPLLYAFIYNNEVVRDVPAVVVDNSRSSLSRDFIRRVDATPDVQVIGYANDMEEARDRLRETKAYGIIYLPSDFSKQINRGKQGVVSLFCDMSGLLYYKSLLSACTNVSIDMNREIKIERAGNTTDRQDVVTASPLRYEDVSLFNPQNGFATFLLPAVLILIIQQTLLLGVGLSAGTSCETNRFKELLPYSKHYHGTYRVIFGKAFAYFLIYAVVASYLLIAVPHLFGFVQAGQWATLALFALPYLMACIFFAMACSIFIHQREACMMIYVFTSVPLLFISGVSWPGSAIPPFWKALSFAFPSTFGINGFVRINTMGASLMDVKDEWFALWIQTFVYFCITYVVYRAQVLISRRRAYQSMKRMRRKLITPLLVALFLGGGGWALPVRAQSQQSSNEIKKIQVAITVRSSAGKPQAGMLLRFSGKEEEYVADAQGLITFSYDFNPSSPQLALLFFPDNRYLSVKSFTLDETTYNQTYIIDSQGDIYDYRTSGKSFSVKGIVYDANQKPIRNANVSVQGTRRSVMTGADGSFSIDADLNHPIVIRAEGMGKRTLPVTSFLGADSPMSISMSPVVDGMLYTSAEHMPEYKGGMKACLDFIHTHLRYPEAARAARKEGVVVVQFVVETDGSLSDLVVIRGVLPALDEEALRLVRLMPSWKPAVDNGKTVRCKYSIPVNFSLRRAK